MGLLDSWFRHILRFWGTGHLPTGSEGHERRRDLQQMSSAEVVRCFWLLPSGRVTRWPNLAARRKNSFPETGSRRERLNDSQFAHNRQRTFWAVPRKRSLPCSYQLRLKIVEDKTFQACHSCLYTTARCLLPKPLARSNACASWGHRSNIGSPACVKHAKLRAGLMFSEGTALSFRLLLLPNLVNRCRSRAARKG